MSTAGRHSKETAPISYFAPSKDKAELEKIARELYPHQPRPLSMLMRKIHSEFLEGLKKTDTPQHPNPTHAQDKACLVAANEKAHAALKKQKAKR
jgi:hypothetical protein